MKRNDLERQTSYAQAANSYDQTRFVPQVEDCIISALLTLTDVHEGMRILDVGAGTGRTAIPLARSGATVVALDLTLEMLHVLRRKTAGQPGLERLYIGRANARQMPINNDSFDVVVSTRFVHLFDSLDQLSLIHEMHRVLKPGGVLLIEYNKPGAFCLFGLGLLRDTLRRIKGRKPLNTSNDYQIRELYRDYQIIKQQGISLPLIGTIARWFPWMTKPLVKLSMHEKFRYLTRTVWVLSTKSQCYQSRIPVGAAMTPSSEIPKGPSQR
jgi:ubiquinone/menaquinone biosynthesis C-methylase UbiE